MNISVIYARPDNPILLNCRIEDGSTVQGAIEQSGILRYCPDIDLKKHKVGVFGKFAKLDNTVSDGDRIEIYERITRVLDDDDDDDDD